MRFFGLFFLFFTKNIALSQVIITIDPTKEVKPISPYLYGSNNSLPKETLAANLKAAQWTQFRESGIQLLRGGGGNNATKYNWRKRLSSHPDWYNNVYVNDWGKNVKLLRDSLPPSVIATWYASMMGEFMKNEVAIFTPWSWKTGMWETVHLFSRYNQAFSIQGVSDDETMVSAYPSVNAAKNEMTVVLVNRSSSLTKTATLNLTNFIASNSPVNALRLANLPSNETFISHTENALQTVAVNFSNNSTTVSLPPLSITSFTISGKTTPTKDIFEHTIVLFPNPTTGWIELKNASEFEQLKVMDMQGREVLHVKANALNLYDVSSLAKGVCQVVLASKKGLTTTKLVKI